jgi:uncharacterized protein YbjT (DUF2867 family)
MKVILFGASGMVGQGALRACLDDPEVEAVLALARAPLPVVHPKLRVLVHTDMRALAPVAQELAGYDACLFCLGVSSLGMDEAAYRRVTYDLTMAVADVLAAISPGITFIYVSGAGTDSSTRGRSMWARVKGETENALLARFPNAFMFRPGFIEPGPGITSKTKFLRVIYAGLKPVSGLLQRTLPKYVTTSGRLGAAMLTVAKRGFPKRILEGLDINQAARAGN